MFSFNMKVSVIFVIYIPFQVIGSPIQDGNLQTRGIGDYLPSLTSWFSFSNEQSVPEKGSDSMDRNILNLQEEKGDKEKPLGEIRFIEQIPSTAHVEDVEEALMKMQEEIKTTTDEDKVEAFNLIQELKNEASSTSASYAEIIFKNVKHLVKLGALGSVTRSRASRCFEMFGLWSGLFSWIFSLLGVGRGNQMGLNQTMLPPMQTAVRTGTQPISANGVNFQTGNGTPQLTFITPAQARALQSQTRGPFGNNVIAHNIGSTGFENSQPNAVTSSGFVNPQPNIVTSSGFVNPQPNVVTSSGFVNPQPNVVTSFGNPPNGLNLGITQPKEAENIILMLLNLLANQKQAPPNGSNGTNLQQFLTNPSSISNPENETGTTPRVFFIKTDPKTTSDPKTVFEISGTPQERYNRILRIFENEPKDDFQKYIFARELDRLKRELNPNDDLYSSVIRLFENAKNRDDYRTIFRNLNEGTRDPQTFNNVYFYDPKTKQFKNGSWDHDFFQDLLENLDGEMQKSQTSNVQDPEILNRIFSNINYRKL